MLPDAVPVLNNECADINGLSICAMVRDATGNTTVGLWTELLLGTPLRIVGILLLGILARYVAFRLVDRVTEGVAAGKAGLARFDRMPNAAALLTTSPLLSARREQRARTMGSVLKSITTGVVAVIILLMVMQQLGVPIAPLLTGAGIVGVALGFGSQTLVKDFLSGIFMIAEDQYGVGDVVDLGDATGVVEAVGLRVTRLRDTHGTVWYLRNGQVLRVGNRSQGWARAVLDIEVPYDQDISRAQDVLQAVARGLQSDPDFAGAVLEDPEVWGIESMTAEGIALRLVVKTQPLLQWKVARELRRRIKEGFDEEGVRFAHAPAAAAPNGQGDAAPNGAPASAPASAASAPASAPASANGPQQRA